MLLRPSWLLIIWYLCVLNSNKLIVNSEGKFSLSIYTREYETLQVIQVWMLSALSDVVRSIEIYSERLI